ncbi:hypothetical protein H4P12_14130 [Paracoccus sp. 11-3]|uniref:Uncharacterized protein n=1 Tax=Paracoccus amoyensis TaxID=2760093 RepID=A0A926GEP5_9RHOB|nr:hypothetical protein [Paracoccus amoyensis]MBC9247815.1 hypothetical protein [Paracoccus amoyensis]
MKTLLLPILLLTTGPAFAQSVGDCGEWTSARNLPEPWEDSTATYADGNVRLAILDTLEPAAAAVHLMVISPPLNELGERQCKTVSFSGPPDSEGWPSGFMSVDFSGRQAAYNPQTGLQIAFPIQVFNPDTADGDHGELNITINQQTGEIMAEVSGE